MIIVMNIIISIIGLGGIFLARNLAWKGTGMGIKFHLYILALKLIIACIIVGIFLMYAAQDKWSVLILSGMINIIIFHFIEAFATQGKLSHRGRVNV